MGAIEQAIGVPMFFKKAKGRPKRKAIMGYRYSCKREHQRIERQPLAELPICTNCHMHYGEINRLEYRGRVKIGEKRK